MDLNILFYLQNLREASPEILVKIIYFLADIPAGFYGVLFMAAIYWCFSKQSGKTILFTYAGANFINGILKVTACVYRPWIRDSRLHVAEIAREGATGYSFPSGHSTTAGALYTSTAYVYREKAKWVTSVCVAMIILTMFARSFLGAHTPQDVCVGAATGVIFTFIAVKIIDYMDRGDGELNKIVITTIIISIISVLYIVLKPYPMDTDATGALLADPAKMMKDSIEATGILLGTVFGLLLEKKRVNFSDTKDKSIRLKRLLIGILFTAVMNLLVGNLAKMVLGTIPGAFVKYMLTFMAITGFVPMLFKKFKIEKEC